MVWPSDRKFRDKVFRLALLSRNVSQLKRLIDAKDFQVDQAMSEYEGKPPLIVAIQERPDKPCMPLVALLLEQGVDPDTCNGWPLIQAIIRGELALIHLLLDWGADLMANNFKAICTAIRLNVFSDKSLVDIDKRNSILAILFNRGEKLLDNPGADEKAQRFAMYSKLCTAVFQNNRDLVSQSLQKNDYDSYAKIISEKYSPLKLAIRFYKFEVVKEFLKWDVEFEYIYAKAVTTWSTDCESYYQILHNHGLDPRQQIVKHQCCSALKNCIVFQYLQKIVLVDLEYVRNIVQSLLGMSFYQFKKFRNPYEDICQLEMGIMQSLQISQGTTFSASRNLFDFIFLEVSEATRFSRNEIVLNMYHENQEDFNNAIFNYGFALNHKLRRGIERYRLLESVMEVLCCACGSGMPRHLVEFICCYFNNNALKYLIN